MWGNWIGRNDGLTKLRVGLEEGKEDGSYQKVSRRDRRRVKVDSPVHECLAPTYGENNGVHIVNRHRLDNHRLRAHLPIGVYMCLSLLARRLDVGFLRILCGEA